MRNYQDWQKQYPDQAGLLEPCAVAIRQIVPDAEVILYGSVARGDDRADSDIDLLVLVPQEVTYKLERDIRDLIYEIELEQDKIISVITRERSKWNSEPLNFTPLYRSIAREGVQI